MNHDPIAEMLTIIRNGQKATKHQIVCSYSRYKTTVLDVLKREGYITDYAVSEVRAGIQQITVTLAYFEGKSVIAHIKRVSKCSRPVYSDFSTMPKVFGGMGILVVSTSKGVFSDAELRRMYRQDKLKLGGEIIAEVA